MHQFLGIVRYEYGMSVRRKGFWLAFGLLFLFYIVSISMGNSAAGQANSPADFQLWQTAGQFAFLLNLFLPVVGGISAADRLVRDRSSGVDELLHSAPLTRLTYILGKYLGVLLSLLTPVFIILMVMSAWLVLRYGGPASFLTKVFLAFLAINVPAYVFITAFSLACPMIIPLRVYQILFTGYWFWGNYLNPDFFPTLSGTYLTAGGKIPLGAWFSGLSYIEHYTTLDGLVNLGLLALCAGLALFALERYLAWQTNQ